MNFESVKESIWYKSLVTLKEREAIKIMFLDVLIILWVLVSLSIVTFFMQDTFDKVNNTIPELDGMSSEEFQDSLAMKLESQEMTTSLFIGFTSWIILCFLGVVFFNAFAWSILRSIKMTPRYVIRCASIMGIVIGTGIIMYIFTLKFVPESIMGVIFLFISILVFYATPIFLSLLDVKKGFRDDLKQIINKEGSRLGDYARGMGMTLLTYLIAVQIVGLIIPLSYIIGTFLLFVVIIVNNTWVRYYFLILGGEKNRK